MDPSTDITNHHPYHLWIQEVDTARPDDLAQAQRVIARCGDLGIRHILWSARDSAVTDHTAATDAWMWGASLWLTMGERLASGAWRPSDPKAVLPPSLTALLAFAETHNVKLNPCECPRLLKRVGGLMVMNAWVFNYTAMSVILA